MNHFKVVKRSLKFSFMLQLLSTLCSRYTAKCERTSEKNDKRIPYCKEADIG